jgi:hypothetical protein
MRAKQCGRASVRFEPQVRPVGQRKNEMIRRFKFCAGLDVSITLDVDTSVMTDEMATEVNAFWYGKENVLSASGGDVTQAVARRAAIPLLQTLLDGCNKHFAVFQTFEDKEGWPQPTGISLVDYEIPELDACSLELEA